ncbi:MAG: DoxX family protein [Myxococcota bacterium]
MNATHASPRERIVEAAPRVLLGLAFLLPGTLKLALPWTVLAASYGPGAPFMRSLLETGYLFYVLAGAQITCGALLLANRFVPLALTVLAPIILNIVLFHLWVAPHLRGFVMSTLVVSLELVMVSRYRAVFAPLLRARHIAVPNAE